MTPPIISVEGLSKHYRLGTIGYGSLQRDFSSLWARMRGQPDPNKRLDKTAAPTDFWALREVSFTVGQGQVLGLIGANGAGKSTLLKVLSRITAPTSGRAVIRGRVASMLEVGTGFHPELTGRENIYLNGAILGMSKAEIDRKFDEIVAFSEVSAFIDTPVKRYSSGMYVRLAFAVAAHLEPEILLVDEVLAVGDAEFQKKSIGKMGEVSREGRSVVFVSHNMTAIQNLCTRAILLEGGRVAVDDTPQMAVQRYLHGSIEQFSAQRPGEVDLSGHHNPHGETPIITRVRVKDDRGQVTDTVEMGKPLTVEIEMDGFCLQRETLVGVIFCLPDGQRLCAHNTAMYLPRFNGPRQQRETAIFTLPRVPFRPGEILLDIRVAQDRICDLDFVEKALTINVAESDVFGTGYRYTSHFGSVYIDGQWDVWPGWNQRNRGDTGGRCNDEGQGE